MNILTFDLEDWFHINFDKKFNDELLWNEFESRIVHSTDIILEILYKKRIKATFFVLGWVAREYPDIIKKIFNEGHDIGSHSDIHNLIYLQNPEEFRKELRKSLHSIENVTGNKVKLFRAPAFSVGKNNIWALNILAEEGIEIDCSIFPLRHDFGGFPELQHHGTPFTIKIGDIILREFPMSTMNILGKPIVLSGGGYFRLFPYSLIRRYINKSEYVMTYFHPRDFDYGQPILSGLSLMRRVKSYYGLKQSLAKFQKLIDEFEVISISDAVNLCQWNESRIIDLHKL